MHQLSCILDSCTISASYKVSEAQKALFIARAEKRSSTSSEEHYANLYRTHLSKGRAAAANRQKLLQRPLGLRALNRPGDYLPPARLASLVGLLWPDASQDSDSDIARLLRLGKAPHSGVWTTAPTQELPLSLARLLDQRTLNQINVGSSLIAAILAVLLIATAPEEFGVPECTSTMEAAGLEGPHRWGIILPNSSRVSLLTYKAIVAVRYPELVLHDQDPIQIGHFVAHDHTVEYGGFRTVLCDAPKDLRTAVEDVVAFLTYLQKRHRDLSQEPQLSY